MKRHDIVVVKNTWSRGHLGFALIGQVNLAKLLNLSMPQFPLPCNGEHSI